MTKCYYFKTSIYQSFSNQVWVIVNRKDWKSYNIFYFHGINFPLNISKILKFYILQQVVLLMRLNFFFFNQKFNV